MSTQNHVPVTFEISGIRFVNKVFTLLYGENNHKLITKSKMIPLDRIDISGGNHGEEGVK